MQHLSVSVTFREASPSAYMLTGAWIYHGLMLKVVGVIPSSVTDINRHTISCVFRSFNLAGWVLIPPIQLRTIAHSSSAAVGVGITPCTSKLDRVGLPSVLGLFRTSKNVDICCVLLLTAGSIICEFGHLRLHESEHLSLFLPFVLASTRQQEYSQRWALTSPSRLAKGYAMLAT